MQAGGTAWWRPCGHSALRTRLQGRVHRELAGGPRQLRSQSMSPGVWMWEVAEGGVALVIQGDGSWQHRGRRGREEERKAPWMAAGVLTWCDRAYS